MDLRGEPENDHNLSANGQPKFLVENRVRPRFKLEIPIRIYPRNSSVVRGHTVDLSETGIAAMLREEVPLGEVVRLEFTLHHGPVEIHALVRQRNAFRYGFQFVESSSANDIIGRTCREFELEIALRVAKAR
ncbi:MAG TPA: PilZ domain-containing protein [Terriglobales bacterium]|nr:PilZ domain-containing protein [Terriglobales bacterium]